MKPREQHEERHRVVDTVSGKQNRTPLRDHEEEGAVDRPHLKGLNTRLMNIDFILKTLGSHVRV